MSEMMHVPDGWEVKALGEIVKIAIGGTPDRDNQDYWDSQKTSGNLWVSIRDLSQNIIEDTEEYISDLGAINSNVKKITKGTLLMSFKLSIGKLAFASRDLYTNEAIAALTPNDRLINLYLYYGLQFWDLLAEVDQAVKGATLNIEKIKKIVICYPKEKKEQEKIAKILSTLDKGIEATNRLIEKEKNIKKALMQELLTNGIDKDGHIRTRTTHTYKESELGLIPEEWEVVSLKEIAKVGSSKRIFEHEYVSEGVPFYRSTEIILKAHNKSVKSEIHISKDKFEEIEASYNVPQKDDILISAVGTIGVPYLVKNEQFYFKDGNLLWIQNIKINPNYLYLFVKSERFQDEINLIAGGSSQSALTIEKLSLLKVLYPKSIDEQKQIAKILTTQDKKIETEETNLAKLKELKKGLMSDLLSGKVRVTV